MAYRRPAYDIKTTGVYKFKTKDKEYILKVTYFEKNSNTEDSLAFQDELRDELGRVIIKNSSWNQLSKGETIRAISSKGDIKGTLTRIDDIGNFTKYEKGGKVAKVMHEFKEGDLKTSAGKKVTDEKQAIAIALSEERRMGKGGYIGFIPMDLEDELHGIAKWGKTSIKEVIHILNAMIDSGLTIEDLKTKPTKSGIIYQQRVDKKSKEIFEKIEPKYKGNLLGYVPLTSIRKIVLKPNILEQFRPFRKSQKFEKGGEINGEFYIEFLNKKKGFKKDVKHFESYGEAVTWGKKNLDNFNIDMVKVKMESGGSINKSNKVQLTFARVDEGTGNFIYRGNDGNAYVSLDGVIYDRTNQGEPNTPVHNTEIKIGEPIYNPEDRFGRNPGSKLREMADGGSIDSEEGIDVFEDYENIPPQIKAILDENEEGLQDGDYNVLASVLAQCEELGYTFEYGLDGGGYDLRPIGTKGKSIDFKENDEIEPFEKGGSITTKNKDQMKPEEYFKDIDLATLPENAQNYIKTEILNDSDIALLDETDEDFVAVRDLIESEYSGNISMPGDDDDTDDDFEDEEDGWEDVKPSANKIEDNSDNDSEEKKALLAELASINDLIELSDGEDLKTLEKEKEIINGLIELL